MKTQHSPPSRKLIFKKSLERKKVYTAYIENFFKKLSWAMEQKDRSVTESRYRDQRIGFSKWARLQQGNLQERLWWKEEITKRSSLRRPKNVIRALVEGLLFDKMKDMSSAIITREEKKMNPKCRQACRFGGYKDEGILFWWLLFL